MAQSRGASLLQVAIAVCTCIASSVAWKELSEPHAHPAPRRATSAHAPDARAVRASRARAATVKVPGISTPDAAASSADVTRPTASPLALAFSSCVRAPEHCDGVDNDCDGQIDEAGALGCRPGFRDEDVDGFGTGVGDCFCAFPRGWVANGLDCDDVRPDVHPGGLEQCDGEVDNDCDGVVDLCGALPQQALIPGDLAIRQVQDRASGLDDSLAERFEIENLSPFAFELMGLEIRDDGVDGFRIRRSLVLPPHGRVVLGRSRGPETDGASAPDYVYSDFILSNSGDSIELRSDGVLIDRVLSPEASAALPAESVAAPPR